jgi:hypothetical protein
MGFSLSSYGQDSRQKTRQAEAYATKTYVFCR